MRSQVRFLLAPPRSPSSVTLNGSRRGAFLVPGPRQVRGTNGKTTKVSAVRFMARGGTDGYAPRHVTCTRGEAQRGPSESGDVLLLDGSADGDDGVRRQPRGVRWVPPAQAPSRSSTVCDTEDSGGIESSGPAACPATLVRERSFVAARQVRFVTWCLSRRSCSDACMGMGHVFTSARPRSDSVRCARCRVCGQCDRQQWVDGLAAGLPHARGSCGDLVTIEPLDRVSRGKRIRVLARHHRHPRGPLRQAGPRTYVNGQVDVLAGGHRKSSLVANESPRGHGSLRVVRWVSR